MGTLNPRRLWILPTRHGLLGVPLWALFASHELFFAPIFFQLHVALVLGVLAPRRSAWRRLRWAVEFLRSNP